MFRPFVVTAVAFAASFDLLTVKSKFSLSLNIVYRLAFVCRLTGLHLLLTITTRRRTRLGIQQDHTLMIFSPHSILDHLDVEWGEKIVTKVLKTVVSLS